MAFTTKKKPAFKVTAGHVSAHREAAADCRAKGMDEEAAYYERQAELRQAMLDVATVQA